MRLRTPSGPGVRDDSGVFEGWTVPIDYDPLLGKLIGYGTDRAQAVSRLVRALNEYFVGGIKTNISLFRRILSDPDFQSGKLDTGYLDRLLKTPPSELKREDAEVAAIAAGLFAVLDPESAASNNTSNSSDAREASSQWKRSGRNEALRNF